MRNTQETPILKTISVIPNDTFLVNIIQFPSDDLVTTSRGKLSCRSYYQNRQVILKLPTLDPHENSLHVFHYTKQIAEDEHRLHHSLPPHLTYFSHRPVTHNRYTK